MIMFAHGYYGSLVTHVHPYALIIWSHDSENDPGG